MGSCKHIISNNTDIHKTILKYKLDCIKTKLTLAEYYLNSEEYLELCDTISDIPVFCIDVAMYVGNLESMKEYK